MLAVDGGARSGWSIWSLGKLAMSGEFNVYTDVGLRETIRVVEQAKSYAAQLGVPWVALIEESWGGRMGVGMGAAGGWWKFAMRNAQLPLSRIGTVLPNVWRARALPKGSNGLSRDAVRAVELRVARAMVSGDGDDVALLGSDEAPALLIGKWGTQAGEIGAMLPKNARVTV